MVFFGLYVLNWIIIMKLPNLLVIFAIALLCLFSLQAFWLYYTYQLHLGGIKESINSIFYQTIEEELNQRFFEFEKKVKENLSDANIRIDSFDVNCGEMKNNSVVIQQFAIVQQLMTTNNIHFNMVKVDSIFHSNLQSNHYPFLYQIHLSDSTGRTLDTTGQMITKGFKTIVLPIIAGKETYAIVKITVPYIFRNMLVILIVSVLIIFFIIACLIYEIKIFLNQHHINQLRENFIHALTHDMKTPLATIHSVLVQLEKGTINNHPDMRQKFSAIAIEQTLNLQATVNRILTLAYIENKQLLLNKQSIDLPEMIRSLIDKFTVKSGKTITFQTTYDLKNGTVYADSFYLYNAISNLIDNSIKYSGDSVKIEIECITEEKQIYIRIKDDGFGISSNDQLRIFKPFERGAEIKRNRISGFGIGLNYTQQIIEAHGGTITVISQEGVGSEFIITLPIYYSMC